MYIILTCVRVLLISTCMSEHRRRKILRVGGAEYPTVREARAKIFTTTPTLC